MISEDDKYQRRADDAFVMAARSISDDDRAAWLRVAEGMAQLSAPATFDTQQVFEDLVRKRRTNPSSDQSHY